MLLALEIILIIYGLAALITGKITLGSQREARGAVARISGVTFLLPIPLAFLGIITLGALCAAQGWAVGQQEAMFLGVSVEASAILGCAGLGMGIAFAGSVEADSGYRRRRRDGYDEVQLLEDDEPDGEDDERPRS